MAEQYPEDIVGIVQRVRPYTMTSPERLAALVDAVRYLQQRQVPGAFAECGVWRGGSIMAMILAMDGVPARDIYLYDTFEGMTEPTEHDRSLHDEPAHEEWRAAAEQGRRPWGAAFDADGFGLDTVRAAVFETGYAQDRLHFVQGPVEETIPGTVPEQLALLRLDTDWYQSTLHELEHLYPRLQPGGVLIIDDYGHWQGCRQAVDEYFTRPGNAPVLLQRIDYTGRLVVKA